MNEGRVVRIRTDGVVVVIREGSAHIEVVARNALNKMPRIGARVLLERTMRGYALVGRKPG